MTTIYENAKNKLIFINFTLKNEKKKYMITLLIKYMQKVFSFQKIYHYLKMAIIFYFYFKKIKN